ncbi:MAG: hypothetical protein IJW82_00015 [Clostridia bacterium]|nr:hypothetical protein [Clostridia bacterium]
MRAIIKLINANTITTENKKQLIKKNFNKYFSIKLHKSVPIKNVIAEKARAKTT